MRSLLLLLLLVGTASAERLGTVSFPVSCLPATQDSFNRGVALLHDFWYEEAQHQFEQIAKSDPSCAMAQWGKAMSEFHQIWNRPDEDVLKDGWSALEKGQAAPAKTDRERKYITALSLFYQPGKQKYEVRVAAYSDAMAKLSSDYPDDVDASAFYALSLLAAEAPNDTSLTNERKALAVLTPLFTRNPDHPGVVHYIIHACDNPALAPEGLAAAQHYGQIAQSASHAVHMPGHIFARLGMWQEDIDSNLGSVAASENAEANHQSGAMNQLHADDFLLYAYLQSGQDAHAKDVMDKTSALLDRFSAMAAMPGHDVRGMLPYYRSKFPVFYSLERRDWKSAAALEPLPGAPAETRMLTYWARTIASGHLRQPQAARANVAKYNDLLAQLKKGKNSFMADSTGTQIEQGVVLAWAAFAEGDQRQALKQMRETADLQDKVGQGEVDIPAREMLADMLLEIHQPEQALAEYDLALRMSPNRFNGLFNAGLAAEQAGDKTRAGQYYATLLKVTDNGSKTSRPELAHVKSFVSATQVAAK